MEDSSIVGRGLGGPSASVRLRPLVSELTHFNHGERGAARGRKSRCGARMPPMVRYTCISSNAGAPAHAGVSYATREGWRGVTGEVGARASRGGLLMGGGARIAD